MAKRLAIILLMIAWSAPAWADSVSPKVFPGDFSSPMVPSWPSRVLWPPAGVSFSPADYNPAMGCGHWNPASTGTGAGKFGLPDVYLRTGGLAESRFGGRAPFFSGAWDSTWGCQNQSQNSNTNDDTINPPDISLGNDGDPGVDPSHDAVPTPEPSTFVLMSGGLAALFARRRMASRTRETPHR